MDYHQFQVSKDRTHHVSSGVPVYSNRFEYVEKFHPPGLAPVRDESGAYHILTNGMQAYARRFVRVFGFYENRAAVISKDGWYHILPDGSDLYSERYSWAGNFQGGRCPVRNKNGYYSYIDFEGSKLRDKTYLYAGDFRNGIAVVRERNGLCTHIDENERRVHGRRFLDLDVYHKGYARARDSQGWFHVNIEGKPVYGERFSEVEPFYNGYSLVKKCDGEILTIDESGRVAHRVLDQNSKNVRKNLRENLMNMLVGYWKTQIIHSIVKLEILDRIKEGYDTFDKLSSKVNIPEPSLTMILRVLRVWNLIEESDGKYRLVYTGELLTENHPKSLKYAAIMWGDEHYTVMSRLLEALKTYRPQFKNAFGYDFFEYHLMNKEKGRIYNRAMEEYSVDYVDILSTYDYSNTRVLLDVGSGTGQLLTRLLKKYENIQRGILFDLPSVIEGAQLSLAKTGIDKKIELISGDFFEGIPIQTDTVLLSRVLHDWDDDNAIRILKNVNESLQDGGRLVIFETIVPENSDIDLGLTLNFNLLVTVGGKERTLKEFEAILGKADFMVVDVRKGDSLVSVIIAEKADRRE